MQPNSQHEALVSAEGFLYFLAFEDFCVGVEVFAAFLVLDAATGTVWQFCWQLALNSASARNQSSLSWPCVQPFSNQISYARF
jgi:hypothetical protein